MSISIIAPSGEPDLHANVHHWYLAPFCVTENSLLRKKGSHMISHMESLNDASNQLDKTLLYP